MKEFRFRALTMILLLCVLPAPLPKLHAQNAHGMQKFEQMAKQLNLSPQQKAELVPILEAEAPELEAIKADSSLSEVQKLQKLKAVHDQTKPQVEAILTPQQYQKLQDIRRQELRQKVRKQKMNQ
ncbi:MAG TPA: hypothetical protein VG675_17785 [Bryobacteraceae bacterium]|nr:hypothetical protein [Bryobacteraceae bacterium]